MTECRWKKGRSCPTPEKLLIKDEDERDAECMICSFKDILELKGV